MVHVCQGQIVHISWRRANENNYIYVMIAEEKTFE